MKSSSWPYGVSSKLPVVSSVVAAGRRLLPRGWGDFGRQLAIWFGFGLIYQVARGLADREPAARAFSNGLWVVHFETSVTHRLYELTFQQFVDQRHWLAAMVSWTYWNSEFTVVGLALLWVYIRRHEHFIKFRNSILLANLLGLFGYVFMPMAPPRLLGVGFANNHTRRSRPARRKPVRGDAEPARLRLADRRDRAREASRSTGGRRRSGSSGPPGSGSR